MASKPKINKMITKVNFSDSNRSAGQIKYLVKHFVGATGGAEANCRYFYDTYRGASAHFFVGHNGEIWQCVEENDTAWHCGAKTYKHKECRNSNSIGVELCVKKMRMGNGIIQRRQRKQPFSCLLTSWTSMELMKNMCFVIMMLLVRYVENLMFVPAIKSGVLSRVLFHLMEKEQIPCPVEVLQKVQLLMDRQLLQEFHLKLKQPVMC